MFQFKLSLYQKPSTKRRFSVQKPKKSRFYYSELANKQSFLPTELATTKKNAMQMVFINSRIIAILFTDGSLSIWNIETRRELSTYKAHNYAFPGKLYFNKTTGTLYSIANEHLSIIRVGMNYKLYSIHNNKSFRPFITDFCLLEDLGLTLASSYAKGKIDIWNGNCLKKVGELKVESKNIQFMAYVPNLKLIVAKAEGEMITFDASSRKLVQRHPLKEGNMMSFHEIGSDKAYVSHLRRGKQSSIVTWEYCGQFRAVKVFEIEVERIFFRLNSDLLLIHVKDQFKMLSLANQEIQEFKREIKFSPISSVCGGDGNLNRVLVSVKNKLLSIVS